MENVSSNLKNNVNEGVEDGKIIDRDDNEMAQSTKRVTQPIVFKGKHIGNGGMFKRHAEYMTDDDRTMRKRCKFDQDEEKNKSLRNDQHIESRNDDVGRLHIKKDNHNAENIEHCTWKFENERKSIHASRGNNSINGKRNVEIRGVCDGVQSSRGLMEKQSEDGEKIVQCHIQGKCLKIDSSKIIINKDMVKLLNSLKTDGNGDVSRKVEQPSPFYLPPGVDPYTVEINASNTMGIGKSDLSQSPFRLPIEIATEIKASFDSHPLMQYKLYPIDVSITDYSIIAPTMGVEDPRLRNNITIARSFLR